MGKLIFKTDVTPAAERNVKYAIDAMVTDPSHAIASHTFSRALPNVLFYETASIMKTNILDPLRTFLKTVEDRYVFGRIAPSFFVADLARVSVTQNQLHYRCNFLSDFQPNVQDSDLMIAKNASHFPGLPLDGAQKVASETINMNGTTGCELK